MSAGEMTQQEVDTLSAVREVMQGIDWRLEAVITFGHGVGVQVYQNVGVQRAKWVKVGPLIVPPDGGTVADTLTILGGLAAAS